MRNLGVSHIVLRVSAQSLNKDFADDDDDDDDQRIHIDAYLRNTRYKKVSNLKPWTSERGHLRYHVILDGITDAVSVDFRNTNCDDNTQAHHSMVELLEPWIPGIEQIYFVAEK